MYQFIFYPTDYVQSLIVMHNRRKGGTKILRNPFEQEYNSNPFEYPDREEILATIGVDNI